MTSFLTLLLCTLLKCTLLFSINNGIYFPFFLIWASLWLTAKVVMCELQTEASRVLTRFHLLFYKASSTREQQEAWAGWWRRKVTWIRVTLDGPSQTPGMWVIPAKITNDSANSPVDHKWLSMNNREPSSLGLNRKNSLSDLQTNK